MRILGVTPTSNDVSWAIVEGTKSSPVVVPLDSTKQKFPAGKNESDLLHDLYRFALSFCRIRGLIKVIYCRRNKPIWETSSIRVEN